MIIEKQSVLTGVYHTRDIPVTEEQLDRHRKGELIQDVCPELTGDDREFLITGITPEEWREAVTCTNCGDE